MKRKKKIYDVLQEDCVIFRAAITENNHKMLKDLFTYFEQEQYILKDEKYNEAKEKLVKNLHKIVIDVKYFSPKIGFILSEYIDFRNEKSEEISYKEKIKNLLFDKKTTDQTSDSNQDKEFIQITDTYFVDNSSGELVHYYAHKSNDEKIEQIGEGDTEDHLHNDNL